MAAPLFRRCFVSHQQRHSLWYVSSRYCRYISGVFGDDPDRGPDEPRMLPSLPTNYFKDTRLRSTKEGGSDPLIQRRDLSYLDPDFVDRVDKIEKTVFLKPDWRRDLASDPVAVISATITDYLLSLSQKGSLTGRQKIDSGALNQMLDGVRNLTELRVAEFGCGNGTNSVVPVRTVIEALRRLERQDPDKIIPTSVIVNHVDCNIKGGMYSDWAALFDVINSDNSYMTGQQAIFPSVIGCKNSLVTDRLFPRASQDFIFSTVGLQTLSTIPFDETKCKACLFIREIYPDVDDPLPDGSKPKTDDPRKMIDDDDYDGISPKQWKLIKQQSADDLKRFLINRASELKPGARLSLSILGGNGALRDLGVKSTQIPALFEKNLRMSGVAKQGCVPMHFRDLKEVRQVVLEICWSRIKLDDRHLSSSKSSSSSLASKATEAMSGALSSLTGSDEKSSEESDLMKKSNDRESKLFELDMMWEDSMIHPAYTAWVEQQESLANSGELPKGPQIGAGEGGVPIYQEIPQLDWSDVVEMGVDGMKETLTPDMLRFCDEDQWNEICEATKTELSTNPGSDSFAINMINVLLTRTDATVA